MTNNAPQPDQNLRLNLGDGSFVVDLPTVADGGLVRNIFFQAEDASYLINGDVKDDFVVSARAEGASVAVNGRIGDDVKNKADNGFFFFDVIEGDIRSTKGTEGNYFDFWSVTNVILVDEVGTQFFGQQADGFDFTSSFNIYGLVAEVTGQIDINFGINVTLDIGQFSGQTINESGFATTINITNGAVTLTTDGGGDQYSLSDDDDLVFFDGNMVGGVTEIDFGGGDGDQLTVNQAFGHTIVLEGTPPAFILDNTSGGDFNVSVAADQFEFTNGADQGRDPGYVYDLDGGGTIYVDNDTYADWLVA